MAIARPVDRRLFFILDRAHTRLCKEADNYLAEKSGAVSYTHLTLPTKA